MPRAQAQKESYRQEKKRATRQLLSALTDPSVVIMADSLKVSAGPHLTAASGGHPQGRRRVTSPSEDSWACSAQLQAVATSWGAPDQGPQAGGLQQPKRTPRSRGGSPKSRSWWDRLLPKAQKEGSSCLSPPLQALGVPGLVATSLQPLPLWSPGLLLGLCVLFSYKDTVIGPEPLLQEHLIFARSCLQKSYFCLRWGGGTPDLRGAQSPVESPAGDTGRRRRAGFWGQAWAVVRGLCSDLTEAVSNSLSPKPQFPPP